MLLYFFCDAYDERRNSAVAVLRGLIFQLVKQQPSVVKTLLQDYEILGDNLFSIQLFNSLWKVFERMMYEATAQKVYCIIDGLDECKDSSVGHLLENINNLIGNLSSKRPSNQQPPVTLSIAGQEIQRLAQECSSDLSKEPAGQPCKDFRIIFLGRDSHAYLSRNLSGPQLVHISPDRLNFQSDLKTHINVKLERISRAKGITVSDTALASDILNTRGDGTFLWADLALRKLGSLSTNLFLQTLNNMPSTVEGIYHQTLLSIPDNSKYLAAALLRWITIAVRPLQLKELEVGLSLSTGANIDQSLLKRTIAFCESMIVVCEGEITLIHQTTRDFLILTTSSLKQDPRLRQFDFKEEVAHSEIAQACLAYLSRGPLDQGSVQVAATKKSPISKIDQEHLEQFSFLSYAAINWTTHAHHSAPGGMDFSSPFFKPTSTLREIWWNTYWVSTHPACTWRWIAPTPFSLLHLAAYFGILPLAVALENQGLLPDQLAERDNYSNRAITYAIQKGHSDIVSFMLHRGALKISTKWLGNMDVMEEPLLHCAAKTGDHTLVSLLLDHGEQVDQVFDSKWDPETNAGYINALARHLPRTAKEISERWQKSERRGKQLNYGQDETALHAAASYGHDTAVLTLLRAGANITAQTTGGWTAIHNAAWFGRISTIKVLLTHGANVTAECDRRWTPLHYAAYRGHNESVKLLLESGAQIDAKSSKQKTALHVASSEGNLEVVSLLLNYNPDIESRTINGATSLHIAVWAGHDSVVKILLDHGADKTAVNRGRQTPEMVAVARGQFKIAKMLHSHVLPGSGYPSVHEGKETKCEALSPLSSRSVKTVPSSPSELTSESCGVPNTFQGHSRPAPELSDLPELYTADMESKHKADPPGLSGNSLGYDDGLIPVSSVDSRTMPPTTMHKTSDSDKLHTSFDRLAINEGLSPMGSPPIQSPQAPNQPIFSSPVLTDPMNSVRFRSHSLSGVSESVVDLPPPPPYSEHSQSIFQQNSYNQLHPYFQSLSANTSATASPAIPSPPSQATSQNVNSPFFHASPPSTHLQSPLESPSINALLPENLPYNPSSFPSPPLQASSSYQVSSTRFQVAPPKKSPPPLPPRSPSGLSVPNIPTIENLSKNYNHQQPAAHAQVTSYLSATMQTNSSQVQNPDQNYSPSQPSLPPQSNGLNQNLNSVTIHSESASAMQTPLPNNAYFQSQQPQPDRSNLDFSPPALPYAAPLQGPVSPLTQTSSPHVNTATHLAPPNPSFRPSPTPVFGPGQTFAPPPTQPSTPQQPSFGTQVLQKSSSFLNLNIMGKKIL